MDARGKVLLADSNEPFVSSTAHMLQQHGYACDCEYDVAGAARRMAMETYDVLVADTAMSGNENLELVEERSKDPEGIPVILVTDRPTIETAIRSVRIPVVAYMVKPFDFKELLDNVAAAVSKARLAGRIRSCRRRFNEIGTALSELGERVKGASPVGLHLSVDMFLDLTTRNLVDCVADIHYLMKSAMEGKNEHACGLYNCPRLELMKKCLKDSVDVLEHTKGSFKSKELALLRKKIEGLLSEE